jgi:HSP20 family protein
MALRDPFFRDGLVPFLAGEWRPAADVYRTPYGWFVKLELAGVGRDDVAVSIDGNAIVLSGIRRDRVEEPGCSCQSLEIAYSRFSRRIELPEEVSGGRFEVDSREGWVIVKIFRPRSAAR